MAGKAKEVQSKVEEVHLDQDKLLGWESPGGCNAAVRMAGMVEAVLPHGATSPHGH